LGFTPGFLMNFDDLRKKKKEKKEKFFWLYTDTH
jgi:hypothetical protein